MLILPESKCEFRNRTIESLVLLRTIDVPECEVSLHLGAQCVSWALGFVDEWLHTHFENGVLANQPRLVLHNFRVIRTFLDSPRSGLKNSFVKRPLPVRVSFDSYLIEENIIVLFVDRVFHGAELGDQVDIVANGCDLHSVCDGDRAVCSWVCWIHSVCFDIASEGHVPVIF